MIHLFNLRRRPDGRGRARLSLGLSLVLAVSVTSACGGDPELEQPVPLYGEDPIAYPLELWDEGVEGTALLRLLVNEEGAVDSIEVVESSGHDGLDEAARSGARDLRFEPGRINGKRSPMWASLPVEFSTRPQATERD